MSFFKIIDYYLQPIVKDVLSYIQDTTNFIEKINQTDFVPDNSDLVFVDVKSLYTSIPNAEGIKSVKPSLEIYSKRSASTEVITTFLALILTLNKFIFNCKNYLQIETCTMAAICTPSYADTNLYHGSNLHIFIRKHLYGALRKKIHPPIHQEVFTYIPQIYRRYILYMDKQ